MSSLTLLDARAAELAGGRPYVERGDTTRPWYDGVAHALWRPVAALAGGGVDRLGATVVARAARLAAQLEAQTDAELGARFQALAAPLRRRGFAPDIVGECFAIVREAARRRLGQRHYDVQLEAGALLLAGRLVEMATGEGKTLAATLPACTAALAGIAVHVITVNDYLARRDAQVMAPLYELLGLRVGVVVQGMAPAERRAAYRQHVTYCSNKELAFDYLRDRAALGERGSRLHRSLDRLFGVADSAREVVLRGLHFGIVDEADSVFIDDARTPLILSAAGSAGTQQAQCEQALRWARELRPGEDFRIDAQERSARLTEAGVRALGALLAAEARPAWPGVGEAAEWIERALCALMLYERDRHYLVADGKVAIVDEATGRVMPDRSWERGLHQMIEAKEGCELTDARRTLARITYQRLFRRYVRLAGMTGTASEVSRECRRVYGLEVRRVPLAKPSLRVQRGVRCLRTQAQKWRAIADSVRRVARLEGRPVLVGTRSVRASEQLSAELSAQGIEHVVLNARQDHAEAQIVALAGEAGRVTVATNMAGRGTDIRLARGVAARGGLHVILAEFNESRRIDRQLYGRCARQGDPGSCEAIVALDDELFAVHAPHLAAWLARWPAVPAWGLRGLVTAAQAAAEGRHRLVRMQNLKHDRELARLLAFSGRGE